MSISSRAIPIEHAPTMQELFAEAERTLPELTLLELVQAVDEVSDSEAEVIATVRYMLESGRLKLAGSRMTSPVNERPD